MNMKETIDAFVAAKHIAIVGASPKSDNFGLGLIKELKKEGRSLYPVNPNCEEVAGEKCYPDVAALPSEVENVVVVVNAKLSAEIAEQCANSHVKRVWLHQGVGNGSFSKEALDVLKKNNLDYVYGYCPMMFMGKGFHKFHYWMKRTFGKTPVELKMA